jgi:hypothetical protein
MQSRTAALCRLSPAELLRLLEDILGGGSLRVTCDQLVSSPYPRRGVSGSGSDLSGIDRDRRPQRPPMPATQWRCAGTTCSSGRNPSPAPYESLA